MAGKEDKKGGSEKFKNQPGNQTPDTPNRKESERGHGGHQQSKGKKSER